MSEAHAFRGPNDHPRTPIEPLEPGGPSASPSLPRRLYGVRNNVVEEPDWTAARARALGIETPLHDSFRCVLRGHDHSARLAFAKTGGYWQYRCDGLAHGIGLAEVRAFIGYGCERNIGPLEIVHWAERRDFEAGLREPIPLDVSLPDDCPASAKVVAARMCELVGLRDARWDLTEPFTFAHEFAQAYCGLTPDRVRSAKDFLERAGVTYRPEQVRHYRAPVLWKLRAQDHAARRLRLVDGDDD